MADAVRDPSDRGCDDAGLRGRQNRCRPDRAALDGAGPAHSRCSWHSHMVEPAMTLAAAVARRPHASCAWLGFGLGLGLGLRLRLRLRLGIGGEEAARLVRLVVG